MPARISPTIDSRLRPRRYFSVSLIATRWARWPAIRPMPRHVSSGRSPAVPLIAVTGAGLVGGEVDDHDPRSEAEEVEAAGRALGRGLEIGEAIAQLGERDAEPA